MTAKCECDRCKVIVDLGDQLCVGRLKMSVEGGHRIEIDRSDYFDLCSTCAVAAFGDLKAIDMARGCGYERPIADRMLARICETAPNSTDGECGRCGTTFPSSPQGTRWTVVSRPRITIAGVECEGFGKAHLCNQCAIERMVSVQGQLLAKVCGIS